MKRFIYTAGFGLLFALSTVAQTVNVTNTNDAGVGSLRQAILDANASPGIDDIEFNIPTSDPNYNATTGVYKITITSAPLPQIQNNTLHINGGSQAVNHSNSNTAQLGYSGSVGYLNTATLSKLDGPEIEIVDGGNFKVGLHIRSDYVTISEIAIHSFGNAWNNQNANIFYDHADHGKVELCLIGSPAHAITDPGSNENKGSGLLGLGSNNGEVTECLFTQGKAMGGYLKTGSKNWVFKKNEFYQNALQLNYNDGLDIAYNTKSCLVEHNIFHENGGNGFDTYTAVGSHTFTGNTVTRNGLLQNETAGVRIYGDGNTYSKNLVYDNYGAGFMVTSSAKNITISQNSIYGNGSILPVPAGNWPSKSKQIGIDLLASGDQHSRGTSPYVTKNDDGDVDNGGNDLINFPVITSVDDDGSNLTISGFAPAGAKIEFFKGHTYSGTSVAQGKEYLFTKTEGSAADSDNGTGSYGPGMINGMAQGQESNANKFEFTVPTPSAISPGDTIVATATVSNATSEFGGGAGVTSTTVLEPNLECVYINENGKFVGRFGYRSTHSTVQVQSIGGQNEFTTGSQNRGQPTTFNPGTFYNVFEASFNSGSLTWNLRGKTVTADASSFRCPADLEVTTTVDNNTPATGDTVTITVTVKNLTAGTPATAVDILTGIDPNLNIISNTASAGTYSLGSGVWNLSKVVNGSPQTLTLKVKVNGNGNFSAGVQSQNQSDPVASNNDADESINTSGSSGGNNGGIESDGRMAAQIALRNMERVKSGAHRFYDHIGTVPSVREFKSKMAGKSNTLQAYIPNQGPQNTTAKVTTPHDLLGITNAVQVFSADYYKGANTRLGAILALETRKEVYNHTKVICDRLGGAVLTEMKHVQVKGHDFAMAKLNQSNGQVDHAITIVVYKDNQGNFKIDNKWTQAAYNVPSNVKVYNFQVWSVSESTTKTLLKDVINLLESSGNVTYLNRAQATLPSVYVKSGWYEDGKLVLDVKNQAGAKEMEVKGNYTETETGSRQNITKMVSLDPNKVDQKVMVDFGYIFDAGFTITNPYGGGMDQLYFADGPWGVDMEVGPGVRNANFSISKEQGFSYDPTKWHLERKAHFDGDVKNYASLYRWLRPGNETADISNYNQITFEASLTGIQKLEVTLVSNKIENWSNQFRKTITVSGGAMSKYTINIADMTSASGAVLDLSEIVGINFAIVGDYQNFVSVSADIDNVELTQNGPSIGLGERAAVAGESLKVFPNPFTEQTQVELNLSSRTEVSLTVTDLSGKVMDQVNYGVLEHGEQSLEYVPGAQMSAGVYIMEIKAGEVRQSKKTILTK